MNSPEKVIKCVIEQKTRSLSVKPYENKLQKLLFITATASAVVGFILGVFFSLFECLIVGYIAIFLVYGSALAYFLLQLIIVIPLFVKLKHVESEVTKDIIKDFNSDIELMEKLASEFKLHELEYAKDHFEFLSKQLKSKVSLVVGAIEKVGLIPLVITACLGINKILIEPTAPIKFEGYEYLLVCLVFIYAISIHIIQVAEKFEQLKLFYDRSIAIKTADVTPES